MSTALLNHLEQQSLPLINETIEDVRTHGGMGLIGVADEDLRVALYTLLLKVNDMLRGDVQMGAFFTGADVPPASARELYLKQARETMNWVDSQSVYTEGHTERVVRHVVNLAALMNLPDAEIDDLEAAAWVHNIGLTASVGQGSLANMERRLSSEELKRARNHTVIGAEMIRPIPFLAHLVPTVRYHHNHYDGGLNPREPHGQGLPLGARLIAVADAYQAMIEPRAYRPALSRRQALDELIKGAGKQFDPTIVPFAHDLT